MLLLQILNAFKQEIQVVAGCPVNGVPDLINRVLSGSGHVLCRSCSPVSVSGAGSNVQSSCGDYAGYCPGGGNHRPFNESMGVIKPGPRLWNNPVIHHQEISHWYALGGEVTGAGYSRAARPSDSTVVIPEQGNHVY